MLASRVEIEIEHCYISVYLCNRITVSIVDIHWRGPKSLGYLLPPIIGHLMVYSRQKIYFFGVENSFSFNSLGPSAEHTSATCKV
jgi:hypothetical protein